MKEPINAVLPVPGGPWSRLTGPYLYKPLNASRCCVFSLKITFPSTSNSVYESNSASVGSACSVGLTSTPGEK